MPVDDRTIQLEYLIELMAKMHKKLEKAYKQKSTAQRLVDKEGFHEHMDDLYERVPDLTEY